MTFSKLALGATLPVSSAAADEGMSWMNHPPVSQIKTRYGFELDAQWLEHLKRSTVHFNSGGSGAFVSRDGLVLTDQHVGADCVQELGTREKDYVHLGFLAATRATELRCADLELNARYFIEDVTARVNGAAGGGMSPAAAQKARCAGMNLIEKEPLDRTGLRSDVVMLYGG
jgi:hypothetical protein